MTDDGWTQVGTLTPYQTEYWVFDTEGGIYEVEERQSDGSVIDTYRTARVDLPVWLGHMQAAPEYSLSVEGEQLLREARSN